MNAKSSVSITIYDMSGAPLNPLVVSELERKAEALAKDHKLTINVSQG